MRKICMSGSMSGVWKRSQGRTSEAPPDERGGNRYVRPKATASHSDSTQEAFLKDVGCTDRFKQKTVRRQRKVMWPLYLRVLDARNEGVSYDTIGRKLKGIDNGDMAQMNQQDADKLLSQMDNARIDAKKWHD